MQLVMWLVGLITGIIVFKIFQMLKNGIISFSWYHWIISLLWYLTGVFVIGFVGTSFAEGEPQAAGMATLIFGGLYLVITILLYRFVFTTKSRKKANEKNISS
jgi:type VI protein secretion system component VasK